MATLHCSILSGNFLHILKNEKISVIKLLPEIKMSTVFNAENQYVSKLLAGDLYNVSLWVHNLILLGQHRNNIFYFKCISIEDCGIVNVSYSIQNTGYNSLKERIISCFLCSYNEWNVVWEPDS